MSHDGLQQPGPYASVVREVYRLISTSPHAGLSYFAIAWPAGPGICDDAIDDPTAHALPALRWLQALRPAAPNAVLISLLRNAGLRLVWQQTYTERDVGRRFLENYAWTELVGPRAPLGSDRMACGLLLLGPATHYPAHRHEAEEIYLPLSGIARWQQGNGVWRDQPPGTLVQHARHESHAMHTGADPLLALYLWRSHDLGQKASLDDQ